MHHVAQHPYRSTCPVPLVDRHHGVISPLDAVEGLPLRCHRLVIARLRSLSRSLDLVRSLSRSRCQNPPLPGTCPTYLSPNGPEPNKWARTARTAQGPTNVGSSSQRLSKWVRTARIAQGLIHGPERSSAKSVGLRGPAKIKCGACKNYARIGPRPNES